MKRKLILIGCVAMIISIAFLLIQSGSARTARALEPAPAEVTDLKDLAQLKEPFQRDRGTVRLIALLSPVCPACRSGFSDMQKTLKAIPDDRLRVHIVWLPMFPGDSKKWAQTRSDEFSDKRVSYYWDGEKLAGKAWQKVLGIKLRDELGALYQDEIFSDLFPSRGCPAESPGRLAMITVFQFAEGLSDRAAADAVRSRIDWKYALGLELTDSGFDATVLVEFRTRLNENDKAGLLFETLVDRLREAKIVKSKGKQRTDSTWVLASVHSYNR